jgi:hypothetical protein
MHQYVASVNDVEHRFATLPELDNFLAGLEREGTVSVFVDMDLGPTGRLSRFFGGPKRDIQPCFSLRKAGAWASLMFLDEAYSEHRAVDPGQQAAPDATVLKALADPGESVPPAECMSAASAFRAAREFMGKNGRRPSWLTYRYVK